MNKLKLLISIFFCASIAMAQTKGTLTGVITDKEANNAPLPFANVFVKETKNSVATNETGKYSLELLPGKYTIQFSSVGYEGFEKSVEIKAGAVTTLNGSLGSGNYTLKDVVVKSTANREKETAILLDQKNAVEIKQSIGAQEMSRKGVSDVATAVTKTTGITKQEGSGNIFVRGLGDRYNSTTMNGLPLPSNNPSKKNINLDIFSTDIVESIGIDKTFNYKNYGDFSGANIDIVSKNYKGNGMLEFGIGIGGNTNAINQDKFYLQDGPSFTGFSNNSIPADPFSSYSFNTSWNKESKTPINNSLFLRGGDSFSFGSKSKLSYFITGSFDNEYNFREGISNGGVNAQGIPRRSFTFDSYNYNTNTTLMGNVNYKINSNHTLKLNTMLINSSSQKHDEYTGVIDIFDAATEGGGFVRRSNFDRTTLNVNQLLGLHKLSDKIDFNWGLSYNKVANIVPDRMFNTFIPIDNNNISVLQISDNNSSENHRYYQELNDDELAANFAVDYKFKKDAEGEYKGKVTLGYNGRFKTVGFEAVQLNFNVNQDPSITQPIIDLNNIDGYFNQNSIDATYFDIRSFNGGLTPQTYDGQQYIHAALGAIEYKFSPKFTMILGTRVESIYQYIEWFTNISSGENTLDNIEVMPSTSIKYALNEKQNLKFAASKTYTLPQFKERAPFQFEDATEIFFGNPKLYASTDYNTDIKWEYFPDKNEVVSVTAFGKYIQNPINEVTIASATNDISYVNTGEKAIVIGGEFEIKKMIFENDSENKESLSAGFNASYMYNNQDFSSQKVNDETDLNVFFTDEEGSLTGASDLLLNGDLSYFKSFSNNRDVLATVTYNYFSDRVYAIGSNARGNIVDKAVGTLDFILKSKVSNNIALGLIVKNILDPKVERVQETQNVIVESYKKGINFKFSLTYNF
ncbi:MAG TPA: TonB-dependent receptor [Flavobacterium sp.]|nr:TonB-dependent receptor [Flavobacterium sp.]